MENLLAIDYGQKYIGLAFSKAGLVSPLNILRHQKNHPLEAENISYIQKVVADESVTKIIVGMPYNFDSPMAKDIIRFSEQLKVFAPVEFMDEFRSSKDSTSEMLKAGISQKRRSENHSYAAAKILADYLKQSLS